MTRRWQFRWQRTSCRISDTIERLGQTRANGWPARWLQEAEMWRGAEPELLAELIDEEIARILTARTSWPRVAQRLAVVADND